MTLAPPSEWQYCAQVMWFSQSYMYLSVESNQIVKFKLESVDCGVQNRKMCSATFNILTL